MSQGSSLETEYLFGRFRLSADGTMLTRDGAPVSLRPKLLRTLLVLEEGRLSRPEVSPGQRGLAEHARSGSPHRKARRCSSCGPR